MSDRERQFPHGDAQPTDRRRHLPCAAGRVYLDQMVLLVLLVGLVLAAWPTPVVRVAGPRAAASTRSVRVIGLGIALLALTAALLIGP